MCRVLLLCTHFAEMIVLAPSPSRRIQDCVYMPSTHNNMSVVSPKASNGMKSTKTTMKSQDTTTTATLRITSTRLRWFSFSLRSLLGLEPHCLSLVFSLIQIKWTVCECKQQALWLEVYGLSNDSSIILLTPTLIFLGRISMLLPVRAVSGAAG